LKALPSVYDLDDSLGDDEVNDFVMLRRQVADGFPDDDNHSEADNIVSGITQPVTSWNANHPATPVDPRGSVDGDIYTEEGDTWPATTRSGSHRSPVCQHLACGARVIQARNQTDSPDI
jgi:hypothetical protein